MIYVTPLVITFHRRGDNAMTQTDRNGGKNAKERIAERRGKGRTKAGEQKKEEPHKKKPVLCRVESELLLSPLPCIPDKTGGK